MAAVVPDTAVGITLSWAAAGQATSFTMEAFSFDGSIEPAIIDTSHFGSTQPAASNEFGGRTRMTGKLTDATMTFEGHFDSHEGPPVVGDYAPTAVTITWPDGTTWVGDWVIERYAPSGSIDPEDHMTVTVEMSVAGVIVVSPSI